MADNYTQFSEIIKCKSQGEADWLINAIESDETEFGGQCCEAAREGKTEVWIHSDDNCDLEVLARILSEYQLKFSVKEAIIVSWAHTCSKPRASEFGGGAFLIKDGKDKWIDAANWAYQESLKE